MRNICDFYYAAITDMWANLLTPLHAIKRIPYAESYFGTKTKNKFSVSFVVLFSSTKLHFCL